MEKKNIFLLSFSTALLYLLLFAYPAFAEYGWMTPINQIKDGIIGITPGIMLIAIVIVGGNLVFNNGDFGRAIQQIVFCILVISILAGLNGMSKDGNSIFTTFFPDAAEFFQNSSK